MNRNYCITSGIVFTLVALVQGWRFILDIPARLGVWSVPRSLSGVAAIGAICLAIWAFRSARSAAPAKVVYT